MTDTKDKETSFTNNLAKNANFQTENTPQGKVVKAESLDSFHFPDLWFTPERIAYIRDIDSTSALVPLITKDMAGFYQALENGFSGASSYAIHFGKASYRVERIITTTGVQYNCRKMPTSTPDIFDIGLPKPIINQLLHLVSFSGLILISGPTGMGKTTTVSSLLRKYLETEGGFAYTVEDPPEMPLNGLYRVPSGAFGLCKQTAVENERWGDGLKSALRSHPKYILIGEIRTPETASQALRAATSGHLVISTIHANSVEDALSAIIKYAASADLSEDLVCDLLSRSILTVVFQRLVGTRVLHPELKCVFANPDLSTGDQMRMMIRTGKISLSTLMEAQEVKMNQNRPLFAANA